MYSLIQLFIYGFIEIYFIFWGNKVLSFVVQIVPALAIVKSSLCHFDHTFSTVHLLLLLLFSVLSYFLTQDTPGSSYTSPLHPSPRISPFFERLCLLLLEDGMKTKTWALSVLIAISLLLLMGPFRGQSRELCVPVLYVTICICARLNMSIPVSPALTH